MDNMVQGVANESNDNMSERGGIILFVESAESAWNKGPKLKG